MSSTSAVATAPRRFAFLDGIRGIAALGIAVYHIYRYEPRPRPSREVVPWLLEQWLLHAWFGVQMLLVLSGFVIAYTLRDTWVTPRTALGFVARRLVRLTPPYWVTLLVVIVLDGLCSTWIELPSPVDEPISAWRVAAHMAYLQDVFGFASLSAGIWTLCIEVQFYAVCVVGWGLAQRLFARVEGGVPRPRGAVLLTLFGPPACLSLFLWHGQTSTEPWVTHFLSLFFLGMITWWTLDETLPAWSYFLCVGVVAAQLAGDWKLDNAVALVVACSVFTAGRLDHLHDWLDWKWLQYLGRISYSLYLVHYPVSHMVTWTAWALAGKKPTPTVAALILLASLAASVAAAQLLYWAVEVPSLRWAARWKIEATERVATPTA